MGIVTNYICDCSGKSSTNKADFIEVKIVADNSNVPGLHYSQRTMNITKLIHIDVARKLNLVHLVKDEVAQPEPTLESKLFVLLKDYITDVAYEAGGEAGAEAASNRG